MNYVGTRHIVPLPQGETAMSQTRKSRGVRATEEGIQKLLQAKAAKRNDKGKPWTYFDVATAAEVDEKTVQRFFRGEAKDRNYAIAIVQALGLEITEVVAPKDWNPAKETSDAIDWREVCGKVLARQRENQRLRRQATERGFELNVYVPLGLVERKQQQRRGGYVPLEEVYQLTQEVITKEYDNDKFLTEVIEHGKSRRIAIIGEPGAGKTTLQEKIAVWIHDKNKGLPICIPLGGLQGKSLEDYLQQIWLKAALQFIEPDASGVEAQAFASLQKQFREGKVWLLLDGVDEMAATSPVEALATIKEQLTDWLVEARIVLTCRLNVWDANVKNLLTDFETYRTLEFKPEQVEDFIRQWFACAEELQRGEELLRKLQETEKERIWELVRNPLRLSLLCQTSYVLPVDEPLPETKAALYERFTRYFYEWKQEKNPTTRTERRQLNQALGELAKAGINSKARFRLGEDLACDVMGEPLFDLACRLGWLNLVDRDAKTDEAVYAFFHPTFQEYFAALAIADWRYFLNHDNENLNPHLNPNPSLEYDNGKPAYRIFEPQWKEVILLWLGRQEEELREQKEQFIQALVEFKDGCKQRLYEYRAYFLAAVGITEFVNCTRADAIVAQIVKWAFGYFDNQQYFVLLYKPLKKGAKATLRQTNRKLLIDALISLFENSQYKGEVRHEIMEILGEIGTESSPAIKSLERILENKQQENRCCVEVAACSLIKIANGESKINAIKTLIESPLSLDTVISLGTVNFGNLESPILDATIAALTKHLEQTSVFYFGRSLVAQSLRKIAPSNHPSQQYAINVLTEQLEFSYSTLEAGIAARFLKEAGFGNSEEVNTALKDSQDAFRDDLTSRLADLGLGLDSEVINTVKALTDIMCSYKARSTREKAAWCLAVILLNKQFAPQSYLFTSVVYILKACLTKLLERNDHHFYAISVGVHDPLASCYKLLWHFAQILPYPDFYQAWHQTTIHQRE